MPDHRYCERYYSSWDGLKLYFRDYGAPQASPPPVLCLPGLTRNCKDFHSLALRLSRRRRVLCPDYRGRGRSQYDSDWRHYAPISYLEDLRHLLAVCNVHKVVAIGASMGGILAAAIAVAMPCALAGAVLNDIGPEIDANGMKRISAYMADNRPQPDWPKAIEYLKGAFPDMSDQSKEGWRELANNTFRKCEDGLLRFDWDPNVTKALSSKEIDYWPLFKALGRVPVLAIRGEKSDILSRGTFERMARELPGLNRVTISGVGHTPNLKEPMSIVAIDKLLSSIY